MMYAYIDALIQYGIDQNLIKEEDRMYVRNRLLDVLQLDSYQTPTQAYTMHCLESLLDAILDELVSQHKLEDTQHQRDWMDTKIMDCLTMFPSTIIQTFQENYAISPKCATDAYYAFSKATNYVRAERIKKDKKWKVDSAYGELDITINLAKPEKDPKDIAAQKNMPSNTYPTCLLCKENEGYAGTRTHPARHNHRIIPIELQKEPYFLQYSPYSYYSQHCIILNDKHTDMVINKKTFACLFDFLDLFPHYFVGSNADLPIVGGSILSHDHFQGGAYHFAMSHAPLQSAKKHQTYKGLTYGIVHWPMSTIRIQSTSKEDVLSFATQILASWIPYENKALSIIAFSDTVRHNTITPIARKKDDVYEMDLVLRNNRTNEQYPDGIFHPHQNLHHIKKENIGLIEVMGLAVLPQRLLKEMEIVKDCWRNKCELSDSVIKHQDWFHTLQSKYNDIEDNQIDAMIEKEIGEVFLQVLKDCGVFKEDEEGMRAFQEFVSSLE